MANAHWNFTTGAPQPPQLSSVMASFAGKRPRTEFEFAGSQDFSAYYAAGSVLTPFDHHMHTVQIPSHDGQPAIPQVPISANASSTLFVQGLPADCSRREVAHIFRHFVGYKEVRLVNKEPRHPGGDPCVLCFVDFDNPVFATTALEALQGYQFDPVECNSAILRLQYARHPGARSGDGRHERR